MQKKSIKKNKSLKKNKLYRNFSQKGTSIMELMVTISIITLLLTAGIPAFSKYSKQNQLTQQADFLKDAIISTQNYALAPEYNIPSGTTHYIFNLEGDQYYIYRGTCTDLPQVEGDPIKSFSLAKGISVTPQTTTLCFLIGQQGEMSYPDENVVLSLSSTKIESTRLITINKSTGQVSIKKE